MTIPVSGERLSAASPPVRNISHSLATKRPRLDDGPNFPAHANSMAALPSSQAARNQPYVIPNVFTRTLWTLPPRTGPIFANLHRDSRHLPESRVPSLGSSLYLSLGQHIRRLPAVRFSSVLFVLRERRRRACRSRGAARRHRSRRPNCTVHSLCPPYGWRATYIQYPCLQYNAFDTKHCTLSRTSTRLTVRPNNTNHLSSSFHYQTGRQTNWQMRRCPRRGGRCQLQYFTCPVWHAMHA